MAEATDRPAAADETAERYSSVSIIAILGFALAVLYSAVIVVGALIALFNHTPWILPVWSLLFPLAAVAVCYAARARIRNSEGALTGARLTTWGVGLSVGVGVVYAAYYAGSYAAVSSQATAEANRWLDLIRQGQLDQAFLLSTPPPRPRPDADDLHDQLEMNYDLDQGHGGSFSNFRRSNLVRQIGQGGAKVELLGVEGWRYEHQAYWVDLDYRVTTATMISEVGITAVGMDNADTGERQWFLREPQFPHPPALTGEGERMARWAAQAHAFAEDWAAALDDGNWDEAYLDTLPYAERGRQGKERGPDFDAGKAAFQAGALVHFDPEAFWVGPKGADPQKAKAREDKQKQLAAALGAQFGPKGGPAKIAVFQGTNPTYRREGDQVRLGFDAQVPQGDLLVQATIVLTADVSGGDPAPDQWRVESVDLVKAKSKPVRPDAPPH